MSIVLVVSDFPIIAASVERALAGRYCVIVRSWSDGLLGLPDSVELVVADMTGVNEILGMDLLRTHLPDTETVVCSLEQNEVRVYERDAQGLLTQSSLPSLLAVHGFAVAS